jgi:hypothetical protein
MVGRPNNQNPVQNPIVLRCGHRNITEQDVLQIRQVISDHPDWNRRQISRHICKLWNWQRSDGVLNHRTCRDLLARLQQQGRIQLSGPRQKYKSRKPPDIIGEAPVEIPSNLNLKDLVVRPITLDERQRWRQLMRQHHYLGFRSIVGESICYVATIGDIWVALLAWGAAVMKNRHREAWIGWDEALKWRRLHLVANNVRFLVLPGAHIKNLASKVLSANLQRLSSDWEERYGHAILLAETFVDLSRFKAICYRAAGWIPLGETRGFARSGSGYTPHGQPKMLFVRPVHPDAQKMLAAAFSPPVVPGGKEKSSVIDVNRLPLEGKDGLIDVLRTVVDPRKRRGIRHPLICILAIATCACLSGARSFEAIAEWAAELSRDALKRLGSKRGRAPSEKCFRMTLQRLDPSQFDEKICSWLARLKVFANEGIALDGKTLRGAHDGDKAAPHLLGAVLHREGVIVAQVAVGEKTNEIPCVKPLLKDLNIEGAVVTADALHTQKETARFVVEDKKADYVFTAKDNQPTLLQDIKDLGLEAFPPSAH